MDTAWDYKGKWNKLDTEDIRLFLTWGAHSIRNLKNKGKDRWF